MVVRRSSGGGDGSNDGALCVRTVVMGGDDRWWKAQLQWKGGDCVVLSGFIRFGRGDLGGNQKISFGKITNKTHGISTNFC